MKYTSAQANKLLKKLNDEYSALLHKEQRSRDFRAAMGEDIESVRPAYDYAKTQARLEELEGTIRRLKHAINSLQHDAGRGWLRDYDRRDAGLYSAADQAEEQAA